MHSLKRWIKFIFGFSRRETNGFLILVPLIVLILFSQHLYTAVFRSGPKDFTEESVRLDSMMALLANQNTRDSSITTKVNSLFPFDPNTAMFDQLKMLGFEDATANNLMRYRERGGRFFVKSDLLKIYGMDSVFYRSIYPYIELPVVKDASESARRMYATNKTDTLFDLNLADSVKFLEIYGIGPVLSSRIVRFRDKLGGFIHENQLREVYGLDSVVVKRLNGLSYIKQSFKPRKINLNTCTEKDLSSHPYLSRSEASAIVAYRFQHGAFQSLEDIRNIQNIGEKTFLRIEPYLTVDQ